ncbi:protein-export chaperone SecB [Rhodoferax saidenbachensis]|uniref:protein-export chaperone SecB n=1 Tax=Rhodoferax saidenbachensis TaxID=1484693 RepID=UPI000566DDA7|nr:protein-export chaperone SecB [Rhodoferax saidenbachensis]
MQASPIQTKSIIYRRVGVEAHLDADGNTDTTIDPKNFQWDGVKLEVETALGVDQSQGDEPSSFMLSLVVRVRNEEGKICPYKLDIELVAFVEINPKLSAARREDLATVNGLAIAYGATRELVTNLTARMEYGPLTLPGVNFQDHAATPEVAPPDKT